MTVERAYDKDPVPHVRVIQSLYEILCSRYDLKGVAERAAEGECRELFLEIVEAIPSDLYFLTWVCGNPDCEGPREEEMTYDDLADTVLQRPGRTNPPTCPDCGSSLILDSDLLLSAGNRRKRA